MSEVYNTDNSSKERELSTSSNQLDESEYPFAGTQEMDSMNATRRGSFISTPYEEDIEEEIDEPVPFEGTNLNDIEDKESQKGASFLERKLSNYSFFNKELKSARFRLVRGFLTNYIIIAALILSIFSIYWGSYYQRNSRLHNLKMLVVIEDQKVDGIEPFIGNALETLLNTDGKVYGDWNIYNASEFQAEARMHGNNVTTEIRRQIHHQLYWSAFYVPPNATYNLYQAILNANGSYNFNLSLVNSIYETGRDFLNMNSYVTPNLKILEQGFLRMQPELMSNITSKISSSDMSKVSSNSDSLKLLTTPLSFNFYDMIPFTDAVVIAPSQVGLIYLIIITLFQVNFFQEIHQEVGKLHLKHQVYLLYRVFASILSYFVLSLFYSLVTLAMQVDFTKAFGKSGFLVYWMVSFLCMWVVGMINEVVVMFFVMFYPPLIGFWLLFWVIVNISPTFSPMALLPKVFRYGYALPLHNTYELNKVIFFNTYKGQMGRNVGILIAWLVIATLSMILMLPWFGKTMRKRAIAAAAAQSPAPAAKEKGH